MGPEAPSCSGFQCPSTGQCLQEAEICNGKPDCLYAEDENVTFCEQRQINCLQNYPDYPQWCCKYFIGNYPI